MNSFAPEKEELMTYQEFIEGVQKETVAGTFVLKDGRRSNNQ